MLFGDASAFRDDEMKSKGEKPISFWATLPGILTGLAAIVTAIGGLFVALHTAGPEGNGGDAPTAAAEGSITTSGDQSPVVSGTSGNVNIEVTK